MLRNTIIALVVSATFAMPAHAQLSRLRSLAGGSSNDTTAANAVAAMPDEAAQEALVQRFVASQTHSIRAQTAFAQAFGLAEQVQLLEAERLALSSGSVNTDALRKARSVSENVQKALDERQAQQPELTDEARAHYAEGLDALLQSAVEARRLSGEAMGFAAGLQELGPMQLATVGRKLVAGAWIAKETPGYVRGLYTSTRSAMTFARASRVSVPENADSMLDSLN